jgi:hypothetical protein
MTAANPAAVISESAASDTMAMLAGRSDFKVVTDSTDEMAARVPASFVAVRRRCPPPPLR